MSVHACGCEGMTGRDTGEDSVTGGYVALAPGDPVGALAGEDIATALQAPCLAVDAATDGVFPD